MSKQLTKDDLNEIITSLVKNQCNSLSKDAELYQFQYAIAFIDGINVLGERIIAFMERKEKEDGEVQSKDCGN